MRVALYTSDGKKSGDIVLPDGVFDVPMNADLLHQAVRVLRARSRRVIAHTKSRSEVRGGGRKPWRQKGTGRARHGSIRSPLWRGGGVTFGPRKNQNFSLTLPDMMRRKALAVALSAKVRDGEVIVLESLAVSQPKTKEMERIVKNLLAYATPPKTTKRPPTVTVATPDTDILVSRATRNLPYAKTISVRDLTVLDVLSSRYLVFSKDAIPVFEARIHKEKKRIAGKKK